MVLLHTGTNFPAVNVKSLLAVAMMKTRQRWNETGVPIQSHPQAASLTLSAWNKAMFFYTANTLIKYVCLDSWWSEITHYLPAP
jgi:aryl carrier-like protein